MIRSILRAGSSRGLATSAVKNDFDFFDNDVAMLNHASFGAVPLPVQEVQRDYQDRWMRHADSWYFGGKLEESMLDSARVVGEFIGAKEEEVCLLGNATDATITVLHRWNRKLQESSSSSSSVISLNYAYRANKIALGYYIEPHAKVIYTQVPFPYRSFDSSFFPTVLENLERDLRTHRPRYALLEHIHSQPAICLPIKDMVQLCRDYGVDEIAVDGAHGVGSIPDLDVPKIGADFYYSNLHKWGFSPHTSTVVYAREDMMRSTIHPIVSWSHGMGLKKESLFLGTRDYSALLSSAAAIRYLQDSVKGIETRNRDSVLRHSKMLREAWGTEKAQPDESVCGMTMVQLPHDLIVNDIPGTPDAGVRDLLRDTYGVEAALGNFKEHGNYVRLSCCSAYNTTKDYEKLRDAILDILHSQQQHVTTTN